ncbi:hypothetical protein H0V99_03685 [Candidatus Saccharibacteria bacterium]|nr:hypothetical protein [Candidatus Saccharibacteria bacterium]
MNSYTLWENDIFIVSTPYNPHLPYREGMHIVAAPKRKMANAWTDVDLAADTFRLAAMVCKLIEKLQLSPWFNLQANGNWGLLPGAEPFFHIHIYSRNKTETWAKPLVLPEAPRTYQNDPMPKADRIILIEAFKALK